jgi:unspecific monooxygenase
MVWQRYREEDVHAIYAAHKKHGPIVRLGPNELSVNCIDGGLRSVYAGNFEKAPWYQIFMNYGVPSMFSMLDNRSHSVQKRKISNVYSKSFLQSSPDMSSLSAGIVFERLFPILESLAAESTPVNIHELNFATGMDFMTAYLFGMPNGSNFLQDVKARQTWLAVYQSWRPYYFWASEFPRLAKLMWFWKNLRAYTTSSWLDVMDNKLESTCMQMCHAVRSTLKSALPSSPAAPSRATAPVVYNQLAKPSSDKGPQPPFPFPQDLAIASELLDHEIAGHETIGITLTYYFHQLSQRPSLQASLRAELLSLDPALKYPSEAKSLPHPRSIDALPLLHATLMETLRRYVVAPGPLPRVTPKTPTSLAGSPPLPAGVIVSANAYCLHRNEEVFPDPESWLPERWLNQSKEQTDNMMRWFWAFGSGGRMCIGSNFAMQEMKLVIAAIYTNYTTHIVDDTGIEQVEAFIAGPRSNRLILRFERA